MGEVELDLAAGQMVIHSHIVTYGNSATISLTEQIRDEIETMWNEPRGRVEIEGVVLSVRFRITAEMKQDLSEMEVLQNTDPRMNYFRIEDFAFTDISFVDGLGCNTGYFKTGNLLKGWTTAAHEYGHTLGLDHPRHLDIRGGGVPGIMYPRGTLVDAQYQYDPSKPAGVTGGTMHPMHRRVKQQDINDLKLHRIEYYNNRGVVGQFSNIYHWNHAEGRPEDFFRPPIFG